MQRRLKWFFLAAALLLMLPAALYVWYRYDTRVVGDQPPYFDLFIADKLFGDDTSSPFDIVPIDQRRPVEWTFEASHFLEHDTVVVSLRNTSGEKFHYSSWGAPLTRLRVDLIVFRDGTVDSIPFGGFGCSTGIFAAPIGAGETISGTIYNPLMYDPYSHYELPMEADSIPEVLETLFGDSVGIRFSQDTYSLPWNKYPSQRIFSNRIVISTARVLDHWRERRNTRFPTHDPTVEE